MVSSESSSGAVARVDPMFFALEARGGGDGIYAVEDLSMARRGVEKYSVE